MFDCPSYAHKHPPLVAGIGLAQQQEHGAVVRRGCHVVALDDGGLLRHANLAQQGGADGRMVAVDVERVAESARALHQAR